MAPSKEIIGQIKNDFFQGPDHETLPLVNGLEDVFWVWFSENSHIYEPINPDADFLNENYLAGQCFRNSQILAFNTGLKYIEGFAKAQETNRYIFHGFNLKSNMAVDVTAAVFSNQFKEHLGGLPYIYVGVEIPPDLIKKKIQIGLLINI